MLHNRRTQPHASAGFTLVELVAVLTLIGILSVSVIPAIEVIGKAHQAGMTQEIRRQLALVRDRAVATGEPSALNFDLSQQTLSMIRLVSGQTVATPMPDVTGQLVSPFNLASAFPGASVDAFINGDGASGSSAIWFDANGVPQVYLGGGVFSACTQNAIVAASGGYTIMVFQQTGGIQ